MGSLGASNTDKLHTYGPASEIPTNRLVEIQKRNQTQDGHLSQLVAESCQVAVGQMRYVEECAFPETELQKRLRQDAAADEKTAPGLAMLSSPLQGNFLTMLSEMTQAKNILEIGMYVGYGAVSLAETAFCESLVTLDVEPYYEQFVKSRLTGTKLQDKVRILIGPAIDSLVQLKNEGKQFDLIFIDANKNGYLNYYKFIMDNNLLTPTGTIACDNVLWYGTTFDQSHPSGKALHEFVDYVKSDERVYQMILPIRDGILLIRPKIIL